jgi:hypothetical protein
MTWYLSPEETHCVLSHCRSANLDAVLVAHER